MFSSLVIGATVVPEDLEYNTVNGALRRSKPMYCLSPINDPPSAELFPKDQCCQYHSIL